MSQYRTPRPSNKYYIPHEEYLTVLHYCRQYPQWEAELMVEPDSGTGIDTEKEHVQTSSQYDPTSSLAIRRATIAKKKQMVDDVIHSVSMGMDQWMRLGVCYGMTYYQLNVRGIPCSAKLYYKTRQRFYYEMAKRI